MKKKDLYHFDMKPGNILFDEKKKIFLIADFETANFYFDKLGNKTFTVKGLTYIYASPELC